MKKHTVVNLRLQNNILNEKRLLMEMNSSFVLGYFKTFRDRKYVYFLSEACVGGSLKRLLAQCERLEEDVTRFCAGCVLEGIKYLHHLGVMYRGLQPCNVLIDERGYCKLTNLMFSKKLQLGRKTFTFCGTPEYVAPEVIINKGHDFAVDYWAIGVFLFEMLSGKAPFGGGDPLKTYNLILKGFEGYHFPACISKSAQILIRKLCRLIPGERIGYTKRNLNEVQKQKWFEGFNWMHLRSLIMDAPIVSQRNRSSDNYEDDDEFSRDDEIPPDETSGWDKDF